MAITAAKVVAEFESRGADKVAGDFRNLGKETDNAAKKQGFLQNAMSTAVGVLGGGLVLGAIGQLKDLGVSAIGAGLSFEQGIANVSAVTGATGAELKQLSDLALQIGKDSSFGANEATQAIEELAKAGVSTKDILSGAADGAVALAAAGGVALPEAASVMSAALNQFGLDGSQATHVADLLAAASATSATGVTELGASLTYVGTTASALGIPIEDVVTSLAMMADQGLAGSMAGTALNTALMNMANPTAQAQQAMDQLGVTFFDANGVMKPMPQVLSELATATAGLTPELRAAALENIFGVEGARAMNAMLASQTDEAKKAGKSWGDYYKSVNKSGAAAEQAAARMDSTMGSIEKLKGSLETFAIVGSMLVLPMFRGLIDGAAKVVDGFTTFATSVQSLIAGGSSPLDAISLAMRGLLTDLFGLDAMNAMMPFVDGFLDALGVLGEGIQGFGDLLSGDVEGALQHFGNFFQGLWAGIQEAASFLGNMVMDIAGWTLNVGIPAVTGWLSDNAGNIWDAVKSAAGWVGTMAGELIGWTLTVGIPKIASAGWDLLTALSGWLFGGTAPSDGTGGQGYPSQGVAIEFAGWILNVAAPNLIAAGWDLLSKLNELLFGGSGSSDYVGHPMTGGSNGLLVDFAGWSLNVAAPAIGAFAWTAGPLIVEKIGTVAADLASWTLSIPAPTLPEGLKETVSTALSGALTGLTFSDIFTSGEGFGDDIATAATNIITSLAGKLREADWSSIGSTIGFGIGKGVQSLLKMDIAFQGFISGIISGIAGKLADADWSSVATAIANGFSAYMNIVNSLFAGIWDGLTDGLEDQIRDALNRIIGWINDLNIPGLQFKLIPIYDIKDLPKTLVTASKDAAQAAVRGVAAVTEMEAGQAIARIQAKGMAAMTATNQAVYKMLQRIESEKPKPEAVPTPVEKTPTPTPGTKGAGDKSQLNPFRDVPTTRTITTTFQQIGGEAVSAVAGAVSAAIGAVPASKLSQLQQMGGEAVAAISGVITSAIGTIPTEHMTALAQAGGETVAAVSNAATAAIGGIPPIHFTAITQAGGEAVAGAANAAAAAINSIPPTKHSVISQSGAEAVASAASAAAAAINAIQDRAVTVTVNTAQGAARAVGGYVTGGLSRLAELGPELVAMPDGNWFMAMKDALYPTPMGSYVYTAGQTTGMIADLAPVSAYASGGYVGGRRSSAPGGSTGGNITVNLYGDNYGIDDLETRVGGAVSRSLAEEVRRHRRANGVN